MQRFLKALKHDYVRNIIFTYVYNRNVKERMNTDVI